MTWYIWSPYKLHNENFDLCFQLSFSKSFPMNCTFASCLIDFDRVATTATTNSSNRLFFYDLFAPRGVFLNMRSSPRFAYMKFTWGKHLFFNTWATRESSSIKIVQHYLAKSALLNFFRDLKSKSPASSTHCQVPSSSSRFLYYNTLGREKKKMLGRSKSTLKVIYIIFKFRL